MKALILTGGSGTRLWPLSTKKHPKQFLDLDGSGRTLLQKTVDRLAGFIKSEDIFFLTNRKYADIVVAQVDNVESNLVLEPVARNTMPAIALAIKFLLERKDASVNDVVIVSTSDHYIYPVDKFISSVKQAESLAKDGFVVTFGVKPTEPATGYGYIQKDDGFKVKRFVEKPNKTTAEEYLSSGDYYWNSGMFIFSIATMLEEIKKYAPEILEFLDDSYDEMVANFENMPNISIDYSIMENTSKAAVVPLEASWSDIGSFDQVYNNQEKDEDQNVFIGDVINRGSKGTLVIGKKRKIAVIDVEDLCIIDSDDAILITKRSSSQEVKNIVLFAETKP
jgi:mannose-1-phosphate guanylyltransferase / mannose-6-phosphate isomerase